MKSAPCRTLVFSFLGGVWVHGLDHIPTAGRLDRIMKAGNSFVEEPKAHAFNFQTPNLETL